MNILRLFTRDASKTSYRFQTLRFFASLQPLLRGRQTMNSAELPDLFLPPVNRSMKELDRDFFRRTIPIAAASILDPKQIQHVKQQLMRSRDMLNTSNIKPLKDDDSARGGKCLILDPHVKHDDSTTWSAVLSQLIEDRTVQVRPFDLKLCYNDWTMANILEAVLPEFPEDEKETPAGFAQVGHVAHLNLREQYLPYKYLIGQVLLDKNPVIKTVINKTLNVGTESVFRTFPYEVLAGPDDLNVTVSQSNCEFQFNFGQVYWNSRLGTEHERLISNFKDGEAVCDVMAGVGPFAIPAAKKGVWVHANDLNPASYQGLCRAAEINKVLPYTQSYCMDGRQFIRESTANLSRSQRQLEKAPKIHIPRNTSKEQKEQALKRIKESTIIIHEPKIFHHFVMNLPASAVEFLDAFKGLYQGRENEFMPETSRKLPFIHVYTFQARRDDEIEEREEVLQKVSKHLGAQVDPGDPNLEVNVHDARLVAPNKKYYCVSFRLPTSIAFAEP